MGVPFLKPLLFPGGHVSKCCPGAAKHGFTKIRIQGDDCLINKHKPSESFRGLLLQPKACSLYSSTVRPQANGNEHDALGVCLNHVLLAPFFCLTPSTCKNVHRFQQGKDVRVLSLATTTQSLCLFC